MNTTNVAAKDTTMGGVKEITYKQIASAVRALGFERIPSVEEQYENHCWRITDPKSRRWLKVIFYPNDGGRIELHKFDRNHCHFYGGEIGNNTPLDLAIKIVKAYAEQVGALDA